MATEAGIERVHGLDALRAAAMLLVIVLHGAIPYMDLRLPGLPWPGSDPTSTALSHLYWSFRGPSMAVFFLLAGFFAAQLDATRGAAAFLRQRTMRLVVPLLAAAVVVLPVTFYLCAAGWWLAGDCTWDEIRRVKFAPPIQAELYGPAHLWFLEDLVVFCAIYGIARALSRPRRHGGERWHDRVLVSRWRAVWLALPTALVLTVAPEVFTVHHNAFVPCAAALAHYGLFFATGAWLYRRRDVLERLTPRASMLLVAGAIPLFACAEPLLRARQVTPPHLAGDALLAGCVALLIWSAVFGFLGLCLGAFTRPRPLVRYLAEASYWAYLVHLPIVLVCQILVARLPAAPVVKWMSVVAASIALCLWSYARWARYTAIGALLNGRRAPCCDTDLSGQDDRRQDRSRSAAAPWRAGEPPRGRRAAEGRRETAPPRRRLVAGPTRL